jgi:hypothetical protein
VRHVGDAQQHIVQRRLQLVALGGKAALAFAKLAACGHSGFGCLRIASFARQPNRFAEVVDLAAMFVALGGDFAKARIEMRCFIELHKEVGLPPTSKRKAHAIGIGTEEADIDHVRRLAAQ